MLTPRHLKTVLIGALSLYMGMVVINNIVDPNPNYAYVRHVLSMDTVLPMNTQKWRAVTSPLLAQIGFFLIVIYEATVAVWMAVAAARMSRCSQEEWGSARANASAALVATLLFWLIPFMVIGGEWFQMWQSQEWNGVDAATRNFLVFGVVLIYLQTPES